MDSITFLTCTLKRRARGWNLSCAWRGFVTTFGHSQRLPAGWGQPEGRKPERSRVPEQIISDVRAVFVLK